MKLAVAVAGKGGTGKTTLCGLLVRLLKESDRGPVLAVDADPTSNLAEALGVESGKALAEIREQGSSAEGSPASGVGRARAIEDEIQRAITESEGFDLVTMGRGEGPRCYCYVNNLLRKSLDELSGSYRAVVLDNEAGMEHLSRRTTNDMDVLLVVTTPAMPAIRAARRILELSRELPVRIAHRVLLVNRVASGSEPMPEEIEQALETLQADRVLEVPQDDDVERAGAVGRDAFSLPDASPAVVAVNRVLDTLYEMMDR